MAFTQDFRTQRRNYNDSETRIGEKDRLWYDSNTNSIRIGDGETPGGVIVGGSGGGSDYILPTASTTVKGGVKVDGTTITIANQVISAVQQDLSSYATQTYVTTRGYLTSSALTDYALTSAIPTNNNQLTNGAGYLTSYTETDPVFVAHAAHNVTNTKISNWDTAYGWGNHASAGYLTSVGTISYNDLSNKPTLFSGSYNDLTNKPSLFSGSYTDLTNKPTIPTNVSELTNDSGYLTSVAASSLTGTTLASGVTASSLTSVGTLNGLTINDTAGGEVLSISGLGRPANGNIQTWKFYTNTNVGGPGSYIQFPDGTYQYTAYNGNADTVTDGVYTTDTGTVTNTMLAGSIANDKLANSSVTINGTSVSLGGSATVTAAAGTLTGTTLASGVTSSSLTSVGTLTNLTIAGSATVSGNSATDKYLNIGTRGQLYDDGNLHIHGTGGSIWINCLDGGSPINLNTQGQVGDGGGISVGGTTTSNATVAFRAGSAAISNVALEMPRESALRNLYNGANYMYFDVSIGGTTDGGFQFRSSSSYNNLMTIDSTGVISNTPRKARTNWNAAIDTELTVGTLRFRVSNQGGIFPQVISNTGGSLNVCWASVATYNGYGITQLGNTGVIISNSAWTTLFNGRGMDNAGDTNVTHFTDKGNGNVYRVTFQRADDGATTGYSIFAERLW